ncbi:MAG: ABC transporter ATP-binding protein/permease, partial [Mesorhizobium sp.]
MSEAKFKPKSISKSRDAEKSRQEKQSTVEVASEVAGAAPPPDFIEPDPELTPEEAEQARKRYLLRRFWISARGYWGRGGDRLA